MVTNSSNSRRFYQMNSAAHFWVWDDPEGSSWRHAEQEAGFPVHCQVLHSVPKPDRRFTRRHPRSLRRRRRQYQEAGHQGLNTFICKSFYSLFHVCSWFWCISLTFFLEFQDLPMMCRDRKDYLPKIADVLTQLLATDESSEVATIQNAIMTLFRRDCKGKFLIHFAG